MENNKFKFILRSLLPKGIFWQGEHFLRIIDGFSFTFERINKDIKNILNECFPLTSDKCLEDWERVLEITPASNNLEQRRQAIASKLVSTGGNTYEYFLNIARKYDQKCEIIVSIVSSKFIAGISRAGMRLGKDQSRYTAVFKFSIVVQQNDLEELLDTIKPAHVFFKYDYQNQLNT